MTPFQATQVLGGGDEYELTESGILVPPWAEVQDALPPIAERPIGIDLFAGCGGFSLGMKTAGFHVAAAADNDVWATMTYLCNLGSPTTELVFVGEEAEQLQKKWDRARRREAKKEHGSSEPGSGWIATSPGIPPCEVFYLGDARALTGDRILADLGLAGDDIGCVFGGPPCQGFSRVGQRRVEDPRNSLVFEFMRLVCEVHPKAFVMENVPGILDMVTPEGVPVVDALARVARDGNFGTYDAIRKSLLASSGNGGALRTQGVGGKKGTKTRGIVFDGREELVEDEGDQLVLGAAT